MRQALPDGVSIGRLHWGGGTPTLLSPEMMREVTGQLSSRFPFADDLEFSVEIDPNEIDPARAEALVSCGVNRASIGVQDFDAEIQKTIGRVQSFETTRAVVEDLRARGIGSLNMDLLYGLPHQTPAGISDSVQKVLSMSPDRVALFGYAHVPWMARRQSMIPTDALPSPEARFGLAEAARKLFVWDGYQEIGIDHFARPNDGLAMAARGAGLRRNFQGYTDDCCPVLIGLGASAISSFPQGFVQNAPTTSAYLERLSGGHLASFRGHRHSTDDRVRAAVIDSLMCYFRINYREISSDLGVSEAEVARCVPLADGPLREVIKPVQGGLEIRPEFHCAARLVAQHIDAYAITAAGHSHAI